MKKFLVVFIIAISVLLSGCSSSEEPDYIEGDPYHDSVDDGVQDTPPLDIEIDDNGGDVVNSPANPVLANRKIIYTANLAMITTDLDLVYANIQDKLGEYDSYVENENLSHTKFVLKIRVKSAELMDFVNDIKLEGEVISYTKTSEDITNSYSTFEARLTALETEYDRTVLLLDSANTLNEIMIINDRLSELEADLNEIGNRLATFDSLVDYSTINLTITKIEHITDILEKTPTPTLYFNEKGTSYVKMEVVNHSDYKITAYLKVKDNGEIVREYEQEIFGEGKYEFSITELDGNKEYTFEVTALESNHTISNRDTETVTTESTFWTRLGTTFTNSIDSVVVLFQGITIFVTAVFPYAVIMTGLFFPTRILYRKKLKPYYEERKVLREVQKREYNARLQQQIQKRKAEFIRIEKEKEMKRKQIEEKRRLEMEMRKKAE